MLHPVSLFPNVRCTTVFTPAQPTWPELVQLLTHHRTVTSKAFTNGAFGPYQLQAPVGPCYRNGNPGLAVPHRCSCSWASTTLLVFDADAGTQADVDGCLRALAARRQAAVAYTSYSYRPDAPRAAWRLVLPLSHALHSRQAHAKARDYALSYYKIPADPATSSSHVQLYYLPVSPPGAEPRTQVIDGQPLDSRAWSGLKPQPRVALPPLRQYRGDEDLDAYRATLQAAVDRLGSFPAGLGLKRLLAGESLGTAGKRHMACVRVAYVMANELPDASPEALLELFVPSLLAMQADGSNETEDTITEMLSSGLERAAEQRALASLGWVAR